jgi:hypothetical protein
LVNRKKNKQCHFSFKLFLYNNILKTEMFLYEENTMRNKEFLEISLNQFVVWEHFQMIYLLFIFNFLLLIDYWA